MVRSGERSDAVGPKEAGVARGIGERLRLVVLVGTLATLVGCAEDGSGSYGGDPGARPLAAGQSCGSIRQELNRLDSRGTQAKVEAATQGKKLPPAAQADVDRYNDLLNQYLGARCHV
jgi:hypothetical protein